MAESFLAGREHSAWQAVQGMDVPHLLEARAEQAPDHPFIVWCPSRDSSTTYSYSEIFEQARRLAMGLSGNGVGVGDFVLLHMDNSPEFLVSWFACAFLGAVAVSTNTRAVERDLLYFAEVTEPICALTQPRYAELLKRSCPQIRILGVTASDAGVAVEDRDELPALTCTVAFESLFANEAIPIRTPNPAQNLGVQFTSGTTSRPKAVLWTHANAIWGGRKSAQLFGLNSDDVTLVFLPLFHTNAQVYSMLSTLWSGGTIILLPRFSAPRFWSLCQQYGVTWTSMIPFSIRAILDQDVPDHRMRFWGLGARVPDVESRFGVSTLGYWGMTETVTPAIAVDRHELGPALNIGRAVDGYDVEIRDGNGERCSAGETGNLYIRGVQGVSIFKEYYRNSAANEAAFDEQGWFDTGDIVRSDTNGWLYFCERSKDMLRIGEENVAASEIEAVLLHSGLVAECAVVGQPHAMLDEVPAAFLIPNVAGAELEESNFSARILAHCERELPDFKVPRTLRVVDELPRATLDKVAKNILRDSLPALAVD